MSEDFEVIYTEDDIKTLQSKLETLSQSHRQIELEREEVNVRISKLQCQAQEFENLKVQFKRGQQEISTLKDELMSFQSSYESLSSSKLDQENKLIRVMKEKIILQTEIELLKKEQDKLSSLMNSQMENMKLNMSQAFQEQSRLQQEAAKLQIFQHQQSTQQKLLEKQREYEKLKSELEEKEKQLELVESQKRELEKLVEYSTQKVKELSESMNGRMQSIKELQLELEQLRQDLKSQISKNDELRKEVNTFKSQNEKLQDCFKQIEGEHAQNKDQLLLIKEEKEQIKESFSNLQKEFECSKSEFTNLHKLHRELQSSNIEKVEAMAMREKDLMIEKEEKSVLQCKLEELRAEYKKKHAENQDMTDQLCKLNTEFRELQHKCTHLQDYLQSSQCVTQELQTKIHELESEMSVLKKELENLLKRNSDLLIELKQKTTQNCELKTELKQSEEMVEQLQQQLKSSLSSFELQRTRIIQEKEQEFQAKIMEYSQEKSMMEEQIIKLEMEIQEQRKLFDGSLSNKEEISSKLLNSEKKLEQLTQIIEEKEQAIILLNQKSQDLSVQVDDHKSSVNQLTEIKERLGKEKDELVVIQNSHTNQIQKMSFEMAEQTKEFEKRSSTLQREYSQRESSFYEAYLKNYMQLIPLITFMCETHKSKMKESISNFQNSNQQKRIETFENSQFTLREAITCLINQKNKECQSINGTLSQREEKMHTLQIQISRLHKEKEEVNMQLKEIQLKSREQCQSYDLLKKEYKLQEDALTEQKKQVIDVKHDFELKIKEIQEKLCSTQKHNEELTAQNNHMNTHVKFFTEKNDTLTEQIKKLSCQLEESENNYEKTLQEFQEIRLNLKKKDQEIINLQSFIDMSNFEQLLDNKMSKNSKEDQSQDKNKKMISNIQEILKKLTAHYNLK